MEAANKFHRLSQMVEILKDKNARNAYDKKRNVELKEWKLRKLHTFDVEKIMCQLLQVYVVQCDFIKYDFKYFVAT